MSSKTRTLVRTPLLYLALLVGLTGNVVTGLAFRAQTAPAIPALTNLIAIDDGDPGYTGTFGAADMKQAYKKDITFASTNGATSIPTANWQFANVGPGIYNVYATWPVFATNAPAALYTGYSLSNGLKTAVSTFSVDQRTTPADGTFDGAVWKKIGSIKVTGDSAMISLPATSSVTIADGIALQSATATSSAASQSKSSAFSVIIDNFPSSSSSSAQTVTLNSIVANGDTVTINYQKNFTTCAHLLTQNYQIVHTANLFCANSGPITLPVSYFNPAYFIVGQSLMLCHGNDTRICSRLVPITGKIIWPVSSASSAPTGYCCNGDTCTLGANCSQTLPQCLANCRNSSSSSLVSSSVRSSSSSITPKADLTITATAPAVAVIGDTFDETVTVANTGNLAAQNVLLRDALPLGLEYVTTAFLPSPTVNNSSSNVSCTATNGVVACTVINFPAGGSLTFKISAKAINVSNQASATPYCPVSLSHTDTVSTVTPESNTSNNTSAAVITLINCPPMSFAVTINSASVLPNNPSLIILTVGDTVDITRTIQATGVINDAFQWNWNHAVLDCQGFPAFDSDTLRCRAIAEGGTPVSITMFPVMADGSQRTVTSNALQVVANPVAPTSTLSIAVQSIGTQDTAVKNQKNITLLRFQARASGGDVLFTGGTFAAYAGDVRSVQNYALWVDTNNDGTVDTILQQGASAFSDTVILNALAGGGYVIPSEQTVIFEVHGDVASSPIVSGLQLRFALQQPAYVSAVDNISNTGLSGINTNGVCPQSMCAITVQTAPSIFWNFVSQGSLFVSRDQQPRSRQLLGSTLNEEILRLQLRAENEDIDVNALQFNSSGSLAQSVDRLELFKLGATTPFAFATTGGCGADDVLTNNANGAPITAFCARMENQALVVQDGMLQIITVRPRMKSDEQGGLSKEPIQIWITRQAVVNNVAGSGAVRARGLQSSNTVAANDFDLTDEGEVFIGNDSVVAINKDIVGPMNQSILAKFVSITNANPDADNTNVPTGVSPFGQFTFTAGINNNTLNGLNKASLSGVIFNVNATRVVLDGTSFKFYNKADSSNKTNCTAFTGPGAPVVGRVITANASGSFLVECKGLRGSVADTRVPSGASVTFVLEGNITNSKVGTSASTLQASLQNFTTLGNTSYGIAPTSNSHINWIDEDTAATQFKWIEYGDTLIKSTSYAS